MLRTHMCIGLEEDHSWGRASCRVSPISRCWVENGLSGRGVGSERALGGLYGSPGFRRSQLRSLVAVEYEEGLGRELRKSKECEQGSGSDSDVDTFRCRLGRNSWMMRRGSGSQELRNLLVQWKMPTRKLDTEKSRSQARAEAGEMNLGHTHIYMYIHTSTHTHLSVRVHVMYTFPRLWD